MFWTKKRPQKFSNLQALSSSDVFVVGNGPSLLGHNLTKLVTKWSFASNAIYLAFDRTKWRPDFYSCVDSAVLPDQNKEINFWAKNLPGTSFVLPEYVYDHGRPPEKLYGRNLVKPRSNVYYFSGRALDLNGETQDVFDCQLGTNFVCDSMTVTIVLMQMAAKLGARRIFLIGCDTEYAIPENAMILDQDSPRVDKRIILESDSDPNHFDPKYFGKGKVWHTPNTHLMIRHYEKVKRVCEFKGIEVYNAGLGGSLEVFPRIDYDKALSMCSNK